MLKKICKIDKPDVNEMYHLSTIEGEEKKLDGHLCTISDRSLSLKSALVLFFSSKVDNDQKW